MVFSDTSTLGLGLDNFIPTNTHINTSNAITLGVVPQLTMVEAITPTILHHPRGRLYPRLPPTIIIQCILPAINKDTMS